LLLILAIVNVLRNNSGFGTGVIQSALFIATQASIDSAHAAVVISVLYLSGTVGATVGMAGVNAVLQGTLRRVLEEKLKRLGLSTDESTKVSSNLSHHTS
jgi:hypothetical protein